MAMISLFLEIVIIIIIILVLPGLGAEAAGGNDECMISRCGDHGPPIRFPFRLKVQPEHCGYPGGFELYCNHMNETVLELPMSAKVVVTDIDYIGQNIRIAEPDRCGFVRLPSLNLSTSVFSFLDGMEDHNYAFFNCSPTERSFFFLVRCFSVINEFHVYATTKNMPLDLGLTSCVRIKETIPSGPSTMFENYIWLTWTEPNCSMCEVQHKMCSSWKKNKYSNSPTFAAAAAEPPQLQCLHMPKSSKEKMCSWKTDNSASAEQPRLECLQLYKGATTEVLIIGLAPIFFALVVIALFYAYTLHKTKEENQVKIELFLKDYMALKPTRYSFADIKKITNRFKDKLGEGGYGTVFKGKLSNEIFVAVKVLNINNYTGNGEEFINEVGIMCGIHHVNVVRLVGFCADGFKQALVYEFLPNESLEKFIFDGNKNNNNTSLGWEKLQEIALGVAKGIEYLHLGCDRRILHFDIKPHNILLDHNFNPKIADFGLSKLCSKEQSAVSMTATRGTMGYIAPEVFSRNFGKVSYKSDVYSFGMLLLEMVSGRKNTDVTITMVQNNTDKPYFPEWVYNRLCQGEELRIRIEKAEDSQIAKKLTIVGLWCIQWHPLDRPSMKTVVQMLEGNGENLKMPPNPFGSTQVQSKSCSAKPARAFEIELAVISEAE